MADLYPIPLPQLVDRLQRETKAYRADPRRPLYTLAERDWWIPDPDVDLSMDHMAGRAGNHLGPASGPHTQMAQNIVMAWLGGARFMELKTVQIMDTLEIPRPCIYAPNIGYNVEWSQELLVKESAYEYVKAWMLVHMLKSEHGPNKWPGSSGDTIFDISVGYDLKGIQSEKVDWFLRTMKDCGEVAAELRASIAQTHPALAQVEVPSALSGSTTLSTFHGCPADEIEGIAAHTMDAHGLHTVIKLNPTLLGHDRVRGILDRMGYDDVVLDPAAFEKDLNWDQLMDFLPRLSAKAKGHGLGFGVKFSNTLVCTNPDTPFPVDEMYLSGPPLHVLALTLADEFNRATGGQFPISFSAGVDGTNYKDLVRGGLGPVTTCSDILKGQGYARLPRYLRPLEKELKKAGVSTVKAYQEAQGGKDKVLQSLAEATRENARYFKAKNERMPKKIGSQLKLLDCISCDKCIKVCPNMSNIKVDVTPGTYEASVVQWSGAEFTLSPSEPLHVEAAHQIGNVVDLCNLCGQCDPWCPEDGGPYIEKPHLFLSRRSYDDKKELDGFLLLDNGVLWRRRGAEYRLEKAGETSTFTTGQGALTLRDDNVTASDGTGEVDLKIYKLMDLYFQGFTSDSRELFC